MDYFKVIKQSLEENNCSKVFEALKYDQDFFSHVPVGSNILFSNNSFVFIYLEQAATFLAHSLNVLCKCSDSSLLKQYQKLSINAAPVGQLKNCLPNRCGSFVLLVYDKSISVIELPSKWGKFEQYNGGNLNTICKSINLSLGISKDVIDGIWHTKHSSDLVVCLTNDNHLRYFNIGNSKTAFKEYRLQNEKCIKIEMGSAFEYNNKTAYPIFILKSTGLIECLIEYEGSNHFENLGELEILPINIENESIPIISFMCIHTEPNCLIVLLKNGTIHHCVFMPSKKSMISNENLDQFNENADEVEDFTSEAALYTVESIKINEGSSIESIKFVKDPSNLMRYFIYHENGVHAVNMYWLEDLQICYLNEKSLNSIEFEDLSSCEVDYVITTNPLVEKKSNSHLIGLTVVNDFGSTSPILIALNNQGNFVCTNNKSQTRHPSLFDSNSITNQTNGDQFTHYITSILKRNVSLPIIKAENIENLSEEASNLFLRQVINLIRLEYIEKQKLVILEFQKRSKLLKQQEQIQFDIVKEINAKIESLNEKKTGLKSSYDKYFEKQIKISESLENCLKNLLSKRNLPISTFEKNVDQELKEIKSNLKNYECQINESKKIINSSETFSSEFADSPKSDLSIDTNEINNLKNLIKDQAEKIKTLLNKTEKLKKIVSA